MPVLGVPLLERTVLSCRAAGITEGLVVVGYRQDLLIPTIAALARRYEMDLRAVENPVWEEGNGTSALAVAPALHRAFFLLMCDHVFDPEMLGHLRAAADDADVCRLAVDRRLEEIFDLPDATKVRLNGQTITAIGKDIVPFDAIDTGLFLCQPLLFEALEHARARGDSSLSGGMRQLLSAGKLQAVDIGAHFWSDVDTPASLVYTERMLQARLAMPRSPQERAGMRGEGEGTPDMARAPMPLDHTVAVAHLQHADAVLGQIIARCGPCILQPRDLEPFVMLCRSIVYQQLSGKAAGTIMGRFLALYEPDALTSEALLQTTADTLRGIGLSRQKIAYLHDLAGKVQAGTLRLAALPTYSDAEVIQHLTRVKGIGRWSAEMFLIFALGRPDVFPVDDLGIRKAVQRAYGYKRLPAPVTMRRHARKWVPYRTIATWYLWRSLDTAAAPFQDTPGASTQAAREGRAICAVPWT